MEGTFDTDMNILEWTAAYSDLTAEPIGSHFRGPVSDGLRTPKNDEQSRTLSFPMGDVRRHGSQRVR